MRLRDKSIHAAMVGLGAVPELHDKVEIGLKHGLPLISTARATLRQLLHVEAGGESTSGAVYNQNQDLKSLVNSDTAAVTSAMSWRLIALRTFGRLKVRMPILPSTRVSIVSNVVTWSLPSGAGALVRNRASTAMQPVSPAMIGFTSTASRPSARLVQRCEKRSIVSASASTSAFGRPRYPCRSR